MKPMDIPRAFKKIVAVGHRGTKNHACENTLIAHEIAYNLGARAIEFDVRCTKDGHFVLMHDATVNRMTNGRGRVSSFTLKQIKSLNLLHKDGERCSEHKIPTLREALQNVRGRFIVDIDFKGGPLNSADILRNVLEEEGFTTSTAPLVTIFARVHQFNKLKSLSPQFALRPHYITGQTTQLLVNRYPLEIMGLRRFSFSHGAAKKIREKRLHLFSNVMGRDDNVRGFDDAIIAGSLFIQTDHLEMLIPHLEKKNLLETRVLGRDYSPIGLTV